mmetsp:Transcript_18857/g.51136  ORF Transcript_18857/g.51136 Transcript_18857/m.51136 type:complete len:85 (+) Transcript_18857:406-660(+)
MYVPPSVLWARCCVDHVGLYASADHPWQAQSRPSALQSDIAPPLVGVGAVEAVRLAGVTTQLVLHLAVCIQPPPAAAMLLSLPP